MSQAELRLEVLDLLARGKITIDDAARLLDESSGGSGTEAVKKAAERPAEESVIQVAIEDLPPAPPKVEGKEPRWLRIRVGDLDTGKNKVTVNIPFGMVKFGFNIARMFSPEAERYDLEQISAVMNELGQGVLVDVEDEEDREHVRIYVE